jgi:putative endonuclease
MAAYVYMVRCANGALYTGWTTDLSARLKAHCSGHGAKFTRGFKALSMVYYETLATRSEAMKREWALKHLSKSEKEALVASFSGPVLTLAESSADEKEGSSASFADKGRK